MPEHIMNYSHEFVILLCKINEEIKLNKVNEDNTEIINLCKIVWSLK